MGNLPYAVSGIVLCGGLSRRMGQDKALLPWNGQTLLGRAVQALQTITEEVIVVARAGQALPAHPGRMVTDRIAGAGPLGGLEAGLAAMGTPYGVVVACDMPWLNSALLKEMTKLAPGFDLVIPYVAGKHQPLHAVYAKSLRSVVTGLLAQGERRIWALMSRVRARVLDESFLRTCDPALRSVMSLDDRISFLEAVAERS